MIVSSALCEFVTTRDWQEAASRNYTSLRPALTRNQHSQQRGYGGGNAPLYI